MRSTSSKHDAMMRNGSLVTRALDVIKKEGIVEFSREALAYIWREFFIVPYAFIKVKRFNSNDLDNLADFCFHDIRGLIKPQQTRNEIMELLRILNNIRPQTAIEIGTATGGTLFLFCHVADEDATIISVDLPGGRYGGGYPRGRIPLYKAFALPEQKLHLIRADSHCKSTLETVIHILNGKKADFLFIDADHSYEGVKMDFEMFSPLVKKGGIIAFHDIVVDPAEPLLEVDRFWHELKANKYDCTEIVSDWNQCKDGIGLLRW